MRSILNSFTDWLPSHHTLAHSPTCFSSPIHSLMTIIKIISVNFFLSFCIYNMVIIIYITWSRKYILNLYVYRIIWNGINKWQYNSHHWSRAALNERLKRCAISLHFFYLLLLPSPPRYLSFYRLTTQS